jgi:HK97 family phage major capsid protein
MAEVIEVRKEEDTKMTDMEMRNTLEYGKAFVKAIITGDDTEARALLSTNVSGGSVPVPEVLENEIKNAWEEAQFLQFAKRTTYKGNVKVGFEVSATGASVHVEGANAPDEETLVWGTVELKAESIKKWITVSDEALEGTTIDTLGEIYKEVAQRIVEKAEEIAIGKIIAAPATTSAANGPGVPVLEVTAIAADTIVNAVALLSGKAKDLRIIMNRQTKAAFEAVALGLSYGADIYDGLKDRIIYTDALDAFSAADPDDTFVIIGDIGYGFQANFPAGNDVKIKVDDLSLAEKDLVKIVGRQYVGMGVVAPKAFVKINKVSSEG